MSSTPLQDLYRKEALPTPLAMLSAALKQEEWKLAAAIGLSAGTRLTPAQVAQAWAKGVPMPEVYRHTPEGLFEPLKTGHYSGLRNQPPFADDWLLALIQEGLPLDTRLAGVSSSNRDWSGSVYALAVLLDAPKALAELARRQPVSGWASERVEWEGHTASLLHLACATDRWYAAKFLVDHGFQRDITDAQGAHPWERVSGGVDVCLAALDGTGLWPRDEAEMNAGWKRRGVATTQYEGPKDKAWRAAMIERMGKGGDFELTVAIEHLLKVTEANMGHSWIVSRNNVDIVGLWNRLSPADRERPVQVNRGLIRGTWSMAGALCWVAAWTGGALGQELPSGKIEPWRPLALDILRQVAPAMSEAELDRPIVQRKVKGGVGATLTARGLLGVAHAQAAASVPTHPLPLSMRSAPSPHYSPVAPTPAWALAALDAWALMAAQVKLASPNAMLALRQNLMTRLSEPGSKTPRPWDAAFQSLLDPATRLRLWAQAEKGKGTWDYALWLWEHPPQAPLPAKTLVGLPTPWEGVGNTEGVDKPSHVAQWKAHEQQFKETSALDRWADWGWPITTEAAMGLGAALDALESGLGGQVVARHRERQAENRAPEVGASSTRRPRLRS